MMGTRIARPGFKMRLYFPMRSTIQAVCWGTKRIIVLAGREGRWKYVAGGAGDVPIGFESREEGPDAAYTGEVESWRWVGQMEMRAVCWHAAEMEVLVGASRGLWRRVEGTARLVLVDELARKAMMAKLRARSPCPSSISGCIGCCKTMYERTEAVLLTAGIYFSALRRYF